MKTVKVRIAVAVNVEGVWFARGDPTVPENDTAHDAMIGLEDGGIDTDGGHVVWVEADVPMPSALTVQGTAPGGGPHAQ